MNTELTYLTLSGILAVLLWVPYIAARALNWGIPTFLNNYPEEFPAKSPKQPLWAERAQRAHLNMIETLPSFAVVILVAVVSSSLTEVTACWAQIFFFARVAHAIVYILGVPYLRTPVYLISWFAILRIGFSLLA
jgi:uncharacterized MAPEG superfamily protein